MWPVEEGGCSGSSGPAVPEDVEESEPVKKLVAPTAPTATDREEHTASVHAVFRTWCRECCSGRGRKHQHRAGGRASVTVIVGLAKHATCSGFTEVLIRSDNEPGILALKESTATALKLTGVTVKMKESALHDSQSNGVADIPLKDVEDAVRTDLACLVRRFGQEFPGRHPVLTWLVKYSVAMVNRCRRGSDGKTAYELRKGRKFARALPHLAEKIFFMILGVTKGVARVDPRWEDGIFLGVSDQSDELHVGTEREACTRFEHSGIARLPNELTSLSRLLCRQDLGTAPRVRRTCELYFLM